MVGPTRPWQTGDCAVVVSERSEVLFFTEWHGVVSKAYYYQIILLSTPFKRHMV